MHDLTGLSIDRYHIIEKLGEGGMAVVYKAYDTRLECEVALKVIRTDQLAPAVLERALKRFEREAKAVARLNHSNIVKVTDYGDYQGSPFLVMPYLSGGTLKELNKQRGQIPWKEAAELLLPIAEALEYAHEHDVIHRDIKPSNILLTDKGQPMLTDFGVAKIIDDEATQDLTGTSATVGTPEYMAPEQVISKSVDFRADIYALGIVFYEMVTGSRPYEADTPMAVLVMQLHDPLPRPGKFVNNLPSDVEYFLIKALAKKPEERYQSMAEVASTLRKLIRSEVERGTSLEPHASQGGESSHQTETLSTIFQKAEPLQSQDKAPEIPRVDAEKLDEKLSFETLGTVDQIKGQDQSQDSISIQSEEDASSSAIDLLSDNLSISENSAVEEPEEIAFATIDQQSNTPAPHVSVDIPPLVSQSGTEAGPKLKVKVWMIAVPLGIVVLALLIMDSMGWINLGPSAIAPTVVVNSTIAITPTAEVNPATAIMLPIVAPLLQPQRDYVGVPLRVFTADSEDPAPTPGYSTFEYEAIYLTEKNGSTENTWRISDLGGCGSPIISPDGSSVAYVQTSLDWSSSNIIIKTLANDESYIIPGNYYADRLDGISWSPDGKRIAVKDSGQARIDILDVASGDTVEVIYENGEGLSFSPDGTKVAFMVRRLTDSNNEDGWILIIYDLDTDSQVPVTEVNDLRGLIYPFYWTSSGDFLLFQSFSIDQSGNRSYELWKVQSNGDNPERTYESWEILDQTMFPWFRVISENNF